MHKTKKQTNKDNNERDTSTERIYPQNKNKSFFLSSLRCYITAGERN